MAQRSWPTLPTCLLAAGLLACSSAMAAEDSEAAAGGPCEHRIKLSDKPDLAEYADYNTFLVDVMRHKHQEEERRQHQQQCPELYQRAPVVRAPPEAEDLDEAVARSGQEQREQAGEPETARERRAFELEEEAAERLSEQYLAASLETLTQDMEPEQARLMLVRIAEALAEPHKDITREDLRRIYEDSLERAEFLFPRQILQPRGLAHIIDAGNLQLRVRNDRSTRIVGFVYACIGSLCNGNHVTFMESQPSQ